jgi:hypothetical protein
MGVLKSKGIFIEFLNSGDVLFSESVLNKISIQLNDCDVLYGNMIKVKLNGSRRQDKGPEGNEITISTFIQGTLNHSSSFIKRSLFQKYGLYDESLVIIADWKFFLIALGMNSTVVKYLDLDISNFDMSGISNTNIDLRNLERNKVLSEFVPKPILSGINRLIKIKKRLNSGKFKMLLELEKYLIVRKVNSIIFRILLFFFKINRK